MALSLRQLWLRLGWLVVNQLHLAAWGALASGAHHARKNHSSHGSRKAFLNFEREVRIGAGAAFQRLGGWRQGCAGFSGSEQSMRLRTYAPNSSVSSFGACADW